MHRPQRNMPSSEPQTPEAVQNPGFFQATTPSALRSEQVFAPDSYPEKQKMDPLESNGSSQPAYARRVVGAQQNPFSKPSKEDSTPSKQKTAPVSEEPVSSVPDSNTVKPKKDPFFELESAMKGQSMNELTGFRNALGRLETVIRQGKRFPMGNIAVDASQVFQLLQDLDRAVPSVIENARAVMEQRSELLTTAKKIADEAIQYAKQQKKEITQQVELKKQQSAEQLQREMNESAQRAAYEADEIIRQARQQGKMIVDSAEQKALRILNEQEILARANMEAEELKRQTQDNVETVYANVYQQLDTMLDIIDRSYSQQLNDIRIMRQQINQNMK